MRAFCKYVINGTPIQITKDPREILVDTLMPTVKAMARKLCRTIPENVCSQEDLVNEGVMAILARASGYDPSRSSPKTFFAKRIYGAMMDYLRSLDFLPRSYRQRNPHLRPLVPIDKTFQTDEGDTYGYDNILQSHHDTFSEAAEGVDLERFGALLEETIDGLPEVERQTVLAYFYGSHTLKEVGASLRLSESRVCQLKTKALERLKKALSNAIGHEEVRIYLD